MLSVEEVERYARHIVLADVGGPGQQKLKSARVLVIGAGGLGSPAIQYLAAAGVGTLGIVDDDEVALSNLQRQVLHTTERIGWKKTDSAGLAVAGLNPHILCQTHTCRFEEHNALDLVRAYDVLIDGSDNIETRYLAAEAAESLEIPLITGAVGQFDGSITTLKPWLTGAGGTANPRYRDLYPSAPSAGALPSCEEAGILGALTGIIGSMQAMEAIKEITGIGSSLVGRLLLYDGRSCRFQTISYQRRGE